MSNFAVVCASGSLRGSLDGEPVTHFSHRWTEGGVDALATFTGAHLLHLAVAACILNDVHREADGRGVPLDGVRVEADGEFGEDWSSTGISYRIEVDSAADPAGIAELIAIVDHLAEIPRAVRAGITVTRVQ